ncbi:MAG: MotA/TolQ/ExbB proton channel family protein [Phycisphaerales bacterium]
MTLLLLGAQQGPAAAGAAGAIGTPQSFGSIFFVTYVTDPSGASTIEWVGSAMIWFLILLSVTNVALIALLWVRHRRAAILPEAFSDEVAVLVEAGRYREALELAAGEASDFSRLLHAGLSQAPQGWAAMVRTVEQTSEELAVARFRTVESLNILGQVSPMIGLFGTVYGMIMAFQAIASTGGNADPVVLAGGIGTALVTTFWGLLIAIPALSAYATIRNRVDAVSTEATRRVEEMLGAFAPRGPASGTAGGASGAGGAGAAGLAGGTGGADAGAGAPASGAGSAAGPGSIVP